MHFYPEENWWVVRLPDTLAKTLANPLGPNNIFWEHQTDNIDDATEKAEEAMLAHPGEHIMIIMDVATSEEPESEGY